MFVVKALTEERDELFMGPGREEKALAQIEINSTRNERH